jgi:hypothetical protein
LECRSCWGFFPRLRIPPAVVELIAGIAGGGDGLIAAGLLSALIFPLVAQLLLERERRAKARAESRGKK